jgi:hypothetical protein
MDRHVEANRRIFQLFVECTLKPNISSTCLKIQIFSRVPGYGLNEWVRLQAGGSLIGRLGLGFAQLRI